MAPLTDQKRQTSKGVSEDTTNSAEEDGTAFAQAQSGGIYDENFSDEVHKDEGTLTKGEKVQNIA